MATCSPGDYLAIYRLFARYTAALDSRDVNTLVGCFAPDATLSSPTIGVFEGRQRIREFAERFARFQETGIQMRHFFFDLTVEMEDDGARATSYLLISHTRDGEVKLQPPGRYECSLIRQDGGWLFKSRTVIMDAEARLDRV